MSISHLWTFALVFVNHLSLKLNDWLNYGSLAKGLAQFQINEGYGGNTILDRRIADGAIPVDRRLLRQPWKPTIVSQAAFLSCAFQKLTGKGQMTQIKYFDIGFWNLFIQKFHIIKQNMAGHYFVSHISNNTNFS